MNLIAVFPVLFTAISSMQMNPCAQGSPLAVEKAILGSAGTFDFEACMNQAIENGKVSIVRFLFNSGYYDFDHERSVAFAKTISPYRHNSITVRGAIYDEKIDRDQFFVDDVKEDFLFACTLDNVLGMRSILSNPVKKAFIETHANELSESLIEKLNENSQFLSPRMLYFMTNNISCSAIILRPLFIEKVQKNINRPGEFYHVNYLHVLQHMLYQLNK